MQVTNIRRHFAAGVGLAVLTFAACPYIAAQQTAGQGPGPAGGGLAASFFTLLDANNDGVLTKDEMHATFDNWYTKWDGGKSNALPLEQLFIGVASTFPPPPPGEAPPQNQTPRPADVTAMMAALPDSAPAKPRQPRKVLVLGRAAGFVHSSIPLAARTIEEIGKKTGAWSTTITYDAADINDANLKQYDAIFLASTTGAFLDDPNDSAATAARRKALVEFVRSGKGLAGIHAAGDAYHRNAAQGAAGINFQVLPVVMQMVAGDTNHDSKLSREELGAVADTWFDKLDPDKSGRIARADFPQRYAAVPAPPMPAAAAGRGGGNGQAPATNLNPDSEVGTWPEFNQMFGAFFKFHWNDGQTITVKIDDPNNPVNAPFKGQEYVIVDETYTFSRNTYSRENLHVLTSIDYAKMSAEDKAKEQNPRGDGDYALSWIRREGKGRVFYEAHGHNEKVYANKLLLEHITAGLQYVLGDLPADDSPSVRATK
jgi:type 1 glutamine amidotransferase